MAWAYVHTKDGRKRVGNATVIGPLAVHPYVMKPGFRPGRLVTITHTPTGYAVANRLKSYALAMFMAERLATLPVWNFSDPKHADKIRPNVLKAWRVFLAEYNSRKRRR